MKTPFSTLLSKMQELKDLSGLLGLASWDQETYLPPKGHAPRASQLATLQAIYHQRLVDSHLGDALEEAFASDSLSPDEKAMVRVLRHERARAVKLSEKWVRELAQAQSEGLTAWRSARTSQRFSDFEKALGRLVALRREQCQALGETREPYNALLDDFEPGMTVARLTPVLDRLKKKLIPMVGPLSEASSRVEEPFEGKTFHEEGQWRLCLSVLRNMGFDFEAGRLDKSIHPFTGGTHQNDVRLTTRVNPSTPLPALFGAIHEGGHGLYEQGFSPQHERTPLAQAPSMGLHESQSRLWENMVGRSRAFWSGFFPNLQREFPAELAGVSKDAFYRVVNRVQRTPIRVEADEVTYNLHIVLRYELEQALLSGELPLSELPSAWNQKMKESLGVTVKNETEGVLQDIHWAWGEFGYFPTYAFGNLYAASIFKTATAQLPNLPLLISQGQLLPLRQWLKRHIHEQGFRYFAENLIERVTGRGLNDEDFIAYLHDKYGELYG